MRKGRCLGLIGGLGVSATVHYYDQLAKTHEEQNRTLDLVIAHADISTVFAYVQAGDRLALAKYLAGFIYRMKDAGAEFACAPAVTPHFCLQELVSLSPLPIIDIISPLTEELARRGVRRAALFGTRFVMSSSLFGLVQNVEIVQPRPDEVSEIDRVYAQLVRERRGTEEQYRQITDFAKMLVKRDMLDVVILAGTDFSLLFKEPNLGFPFVDCAVLHLKSILAAML